MRKVALSLMLAASMAATTLGSTAVFASDATTTESESYTLICTPNTGHPVLGVFL